MCILVHLILDMYCDICQTDPDKYIIIRQYQAYWELMMLYFITQNSCHFHWKWRDSTRNVSCISHVCPSLIHNSSLKATQTPTHKANGDEIQPRVKNTVGLVFSAPLVCILLEANLEINTKTKNTKNIQNCF